MGEGAIDMGCILWAKTSVGCYKLQSIASNIVNTNILQTIYLSPIGKEHLKRVTEEQEQQDDDGFNNLVKRRL